MFCSMFLGVLELDVGSTCTVWPSCTFAFRLNRNESTCSLHRGIASKFWADRVCISRQLSRWSWSGFWCRLWNLIIDLQAAAVGAAAAADHESAQMIRSLTLIGPTAYRGYTNSRLLEAWAYYFGLTLDSVITRLFRFTECMLISRTRDCNWKRRTVEVVEDAAWHILSALMKSTG